MRNKNSDLNITYSHSLMFPGTLLMCITLQLLSDNMYRISLHMQNQLNSHCLYVIIDATDRQGVDSAAIGLSNTQN